MPIYLGPTKVYANLKLGGTAPTHVHAGATKVWPEVMTAALTPAAPPQPLVEGTVTGFTVTPSKPEDVASYEWYVLASGTWVGQGINAPTFSYTAAVGDTQVIGRCFSKYGITADNPSGYFDGNTGTFVVDSAVHPFDAKVESFGPLSEFRFQEASGPPLDSRGHLNGTLTPTGYFQSPDYNEWNYNPTQETFNGLVGGGFSAPVGQGTPGSTQSGGWKLVTNPLPGLTAISYTVVAVVTCQFIENNYNDVVFSTPRGGYQNSGNWGAFGPNPNLYTVTNVNQAQAPLGFAGVGRQQQLLCFNIKGNSYSSSKYNGAASVAHTQATFQVSTAPVEFQIGQAASGQNAYNTNMEFHRLIFFNKELTEAQLNELWAALQ